MAWIRLDDQIAHHPKFTKVSPSACWLYVTSIGFCQKFLTDGFIPISSLSSLSHVKRPGPYAAELVKATLWDKTNGGWQVHDYLHFNEDAATVKQRRQLDRQRKQGKKGLGGIPAGIQPDAGRIPSDPLARARASVPVPVPKEEQNKQSTKAGVVVRGDKKADNGNGHAASRKERPVYQSDRFVVFQWMLDDLKRLLGPHFDAFEVTRYFDTLSAQSRESGLVIPQRDSGAWLQEQILAEARRRRLTVADGHSTREKKVTARHFAPPPELACPHVERHFGRWECDVATKLGRPTREDPPAT